MIFRNGLLIAIAAFPFVARSGEIHVAAANGDLEKIQDLLAVNPKLANSQDYFRWTRLHDDKIDFPKRFKQLLVANKLDEKQQEEWNTGPLHVAAIYGQARVVDVLLAHGADPNALDGFTRRSNGPNSGQFVCSKTPLHWAALCGRKEVAELLLGNKADINKLDRCRYPPIHWAVGEGNDGVVQLLVDRGSKLDFVEAGGWTLLHLAAYIGNPEVVRILMANKLDPCVKDKHGKTPLDIANAYLGLGEKRKETAELLKPETAKKKD